MEDIEENKSNPYAEAWAQMAREVTEGEPGEPAMTPEEIDKFVAEFEAKQKERAPEQMDFWAGQIAKLQKQFRQQLDRDHERGKLCVPKEEFEKWEDEYAFMWGKMMEQRAVGGLTGAAEAKAEEKMFLYTKEEDLETTIEAQAGNFYVERSSALVSAMLEAGANEDELRFARSFSRSVDDHLDYKYMDDEEAGGYGADYDKYRMEAHNRAIKHLNGLNDLCDKYHVRRLTPRNFWTNEFTYQTRDVTRRIRYDRDALEEYYEVAFRSEVDRRKVKQARDRRLYS